ncbi:MAG: CopG family antitoxin [Thermoguttaceae bacterium]|jgi:predicted DNA binding CopG/RHH family protein
MNTQKIPQFDSIQEMAQFWDTHDLTDFADEVEEVDENVFERKTAIEVRLEPQEVQAVQEIAQSEGMDLADLIHQWVIEKIHMAG